MNAPNFSQLFQRKDDHERREEILAQFEEAWRGSPPPPSIDDFVAQQPSDPQLLKELVLLDLECRIKNGEAGRVEDYLDRFPDRNQNRELILELVLWEIDLRKRHEADLPREEYWQRFPELTDRIRAVFPGMFLEETVDVAHDQTGGDDFDQPGSLPQIPGYQIIKELGQGGMGTVYQARHATLDRLVALKMIRAGAYADQVQRTRFLAEARAVARLQDAHIVQIFEIGEVDQNPFFSLEYVEGGNLADQLDGSPRDPRESARLVEALARAMHTAHKEGIIHRDLKPANILLTEAEEKITPEHLKITDFGLAKQLGEDQGQTQTGQIMGTPSYMAPEQASGQIEQIGPQTDVYSLGAILYELMTGRPPFKGVSLLETLQQVRNQEPVPPSKLVPTIPRDLELICLTCLRKEPERRYDSALDLANELECFLDYAPLRITRAVGRMERVWRWCKRKPAMASALIFGALTVFAGIALTIGLLFAFEQSEAARKLRDEKQQTQAALNEAEKQKARAEQFRQEAEKLSLSLSLDRSLRLCDQGEIDRGLLWLARSLELNQPDDAVTDHVIRLNLSFWERQLHHLEKVIEHSDEITELHHSEALGLILTRAGESPSAVTLWSSTTGEKIGLLQCSAKIKHTELSSNGYELLTVDENESLQLWDLQAKKEKWQSLPQTKAIKATALFPDRSRLLTLMADNSILFWNWSNGSLTGQQIQHPKTVMHMSISPDSRTLITTTAQELHFWNLQTGKRMGEPFPVKRRPDLIHFSPQGHYAVIRYSSAVDASLWNLKDGAPSSKPIVHNGTIRAVAFSPDSQRLATASIDKSLKIWSTATGELIGKPLKHPGSVSAVTFSSQGKFLVTGCDHELLSRGEGRIWNVETGMAIGDSLPHDQEVKQALITPDDRFVLTASMDGTIHCWHAETGEQQGQPMILGRPVVEMHLAAKGHILMARGARSRQLMLWALATNQGTVASVAHPKPTTQLIAGPGEHQLLTGCEDNKARIWDLRTGKLLHESPVQPNRIKALGVDPNGKAILINSDKAYSWNPATGKIVTHQLSLTRNQSIRAISDDGSYAAVFSSISIPFSSRRRSSVTIRSARTGKNLLKSSVRWERFPPDCYFSPSGRYLLIAGPRIPFYSPSAPSTLVLVDRETGKQLSLPAFMPERVRSVAFSLDESMLLVGGYPSGPLGSRGVVQIWDIKNNKGSRMRYPHRVLDLAISPDGKKMLIKLPGRPLQLQDVETKKPLGSLLEHSQRASRFFFSPDGGLIAGIDGYVLRLWDVATGRLIGPPLRHSNYINQARFHPKKRWLLTADRDGLVKVWQMPLLKSGEPSSIREQLEEITGMVLNHKGAIELIQREDIEPEDPQPAPE